MLSLQKQKGNFYLFISLTLFLLIVMPSCKRIQAMEVRTQRPAKVTITSEIKKIVIVNRSKGRVTSILEGILTGESPEKDKLLAEECLRGLEQTLAKSERFTIARHDQTLQAATGASLQFGAPLDWETVNQICTQYGADAVLALEFFDSDYSVTNLTKPEDLQGKILTNQDGTPIFYAKGTANASAGFRLYHNAKKNIAYSDYYKYTRNWTEQANTVIEAAAKIIKGNDAIKLVSYDNGVAFAKSIVPLYYWEDRSMFLSKEFDSQKAQRQALAGDWETAAITWEGAYNRLFDSKEKGEAAYNLALTYEVLGDLEKAKFWIRESYTLTGNKKALYYAEIIDGLIADQERLENQK
ncbi:MAG: hypothetical protein EAZ55_05355 [Cytophagales bacterium]|nr:MAG: hypothetical protein EAZ55_05355 [Cytophagales bacterium]